MSKFCKIRGSRYLVCFTTWFAILVLYIQRANISVAIMTMSYDPGSNSPNSTFLNGTILSVFDETKNDTAVGHLNSTADRKLPEIFHLRSSSHDDHRTYSSCIEPGAREDLVRKKVYHAYPSKIYVNLDTKKFYNVYAKNGHFPLEVHSYMISQLIDDDIVLKGNVEQGKTIYMDAAMKEHVLAGFFYGYASTHFVSSLLVSKYGSRICLSVCLLGTTLFTFLGVPLAHVNVWVFFASRVMCGVFSGALIPIAHGVIGIWAAKSERTLITTMTHSGNMFGLVANYGIGGILCSYDSIFGMKGWEFFFYVSGVLGLVSFGLWMIFGYDSPETNPFTSRRELHFIKHDIDLPSLDRDSCDDTLKSGTLKKPKSRPIKSMPIMQIVTSKAVWAASISHLGNMFMFYGMVTGHAKFLKEVFGVSVRDAGYYSMLPFISSFVAQTVCAPIIDRLKREYNITTLRKAVSFIAFAGSGACMLGVGFIPCDRMHLVIVTMVFALMFQGINAIGYMTSIIDLSPENAGITMGFMNTFGSIGGFLNPTFSGLLLEEGDLRIGWRNAFIMTGVVSFILGMVFVTLGSSEPQNWYKSVDEDSAELLDEVKEGLEDRHYYSFGNDKRSSEQEL